MNRETVKRLMVEAGFTRTKYSGAFGRFADLVERAALREAIQRIREAPDAKFAGMGITIAIDILGRMANDLPYNNIAREMDSQPPDEF